MNNQATVYAESLILARQRRGMNKTQLAKATGVTPQTISAYEGGESVPSPAMLSRIAEALHFPIEFFHNELPDSLPVDAASFRKLSRMTASQRDAALAAGMLCVLLNDWLEERFELPESDLPDLNPGIINPDGAAAYVRGQWGLGEAPIAYVLGTFEAHGIRVFSLARECREIDAFSFWRPNDKPFICVGTHKTPERAIFDLAHELGHLVLHRDHSAPRGRLEERQADEFASNFLMPKSDLVAFMPRMPALDDIFRAKGRWKVSAAALAYRLHSLGLVSDWHYRELCIALSRLGRNREINSLPREHSHIFANVLWMLKQEKIGRSKIAADLHIAKADLDDLMFGLALSGLDGSDEGGDHDRPHLELV